MFTVKEIPRNMRLEEEVNGIKAYYVFQFKKLTWVWLGITDGCVHSMLLEMIKETTLERADF